MMISFQARTSLIVAGLFVFSGLVFAEDVPIAGQVAGDFYDIQLRGTSVDAGGENVAVTIYDSTDDTSAFGSITITDTDTSTVVFSNSYPNTCDSCFGANLLNDVAAFELAPGDYSVTETAHEFSNAEVYYGSTNEANAGYASGAPDPTFTTAFTVTAATPEPASLLLSGLGLAGLAIAGIRRKRQS